MIKQDWMEIVAGEALVEALTAETETIASGQLWALQEAQAARGILGVEIVKSMYGYCVRYDSGLQDWGILAGSRKGQQLDGSLEAAQQFCECWVSEDPTHRYAWRRK